MNRQISPAKGDFHPLRYTKAGARIEINRQGVRTFRAKTTERQFHQELRKGERVCFWDVCKTGRKGACQIWGYATGWHSLGCSKDPVRIQLGWFLGTLNFAPPTPPTCGGDIQPYIRKRRTQWLE